MKARARGADFSSAQDAAAVQRALDEGIVFAFVKATQGDGYVSPALDQQVKHLRGMGVTVGVYHFLEHDVDGATQFDHFFATVAYQFGLVACDQESDRGVLVPDRIAEAFIRRAHQRGVKVGRYGDARVIGRNLGEDWKWRASWSRLPPPSPWAFWQFTDSGGSQDWNLFNGTAEELAAFVRKHAHHPAKTPGWWLHDDFLKAARGPYRLPGIALAVVAYLRRHPRTSALRLVRK